MPAGREPVLNREQSRRGDELVHGDFASRAVIIAALMWLT
jgi:hypothetical protein